MSALLCELSPVIVLHRRSLTERRAIDPSADNACVEGLEMFDEFAALQGHKNELHLTITHLLWATVDERSREFLRWAQDTGILPSLNLRRANLSCADLRDADLRDADLRGADLRGADLRDADLSGADLRGADLRDADLSDADLRDADLSDADLSGADLRDADLRRADLRDADLRDADLSDADPPIEGWTVRRGRLEREQ